MNKRIISLLSIFLCIPSAIHTADTEQKSLDRDVETYIANRFGGGSYMLAGIQMVRSTSDIYEWSHETITDSQESTKTGVPESAIVSASSIID